MRLNLYRMTDNPRAEKIPFMKRRGVKITLISVAGIAMLMGGMVTYLWRHAIGQDLIAFTADSGLRLEKIIIKGRVNTEEADITAALDVDWYSPMIALDLDQMHKKVSALGWVRGVEIKRQMPSRLIITLEERQALALYQDDNGHHVIDRDGAIISGVKAEGFTHLPVIKGDQAPQNAHAIIELLKAETSLFNDVWSLTYQSNRRWDVYLRNNIRIQLPEKDTATAWSKLAEMDREHQLTKRDVMNIDLRIPNKLVIRRNKSRQAKGSQT